MKWELNSLDLKLIDTIFRRHPFQYLIFILYKYSGDFLYNEEYDNDNYFKTTYFELLDKYYRYGNCFEDDEIFFEKYLCVKEYTDDIPTSRFIIRNKRLYDFKTLIFNDVKKINLNDVDKGPITNSEIEKWKRKVVNQQTDRRSKLRLLDLDVYHSLITFVAFSKFENRPFKKIEYYLSWDGMGESCKNNYKNMYKYRKIYEDKIYNKIKLFIQ